MKAQNLSSTVSSETGSAIAREEIPSTKIQFNRRSFLRSSVVTGVAATLTGGLLTELPALGQDSEANLTHDREASGALNRGDAAILRFLAAAEILETDLWLQYWELGGTQDNEFATATGGNSLYTQALAILDADMAQYIHDNTDDELSHELFINAYLASKGADTISLEAFRTLPGSQATGANKSKKRLTNLMQLNVDTSFWSRYRVDNANPDLDPNFVFPQAVDITNRTAIPRTDADLQGPATIDPTNIPDHLKAIAFTAGFHFSFIEQGGTSLYASLAQRVTNVEVLRILLSIGGSEIMHFQTWQDKAGNALALTDKDPVTGSTVTFKDLTTNQPESLQANLIMPEPCPFLSRKFPKCSIIRPTNTQGAAMAAVKALTADGLFIGQSKEFFDTLSDLAEDADAAAR
ncbi:MAG: hypothetical protein JWO13_2951 [Acidobacteriales bacterium]|nr:hypothetical protein [Terriglobales bacterium]